MKTIPRVVLGVALFMSPLARAQGFSTSLIEFEMPVLWSCSFTQADEGMLECQSTDPLKKKEALINIGSVLSAEAGEAESSTPNLMQKIAHLGPENQKIYLRQIELSSQSWVDALWNSTEIKDFKTRYVGIVYGGKALVITLSAQSAKWPEYEAVFNQWVNSVKLKPQVQAVQEAPQSQPVLGGLTPEQAAKIVEAQDKLLASPKGGADPSDLGVKLKNALGEQLSNEILLGAAVLIGVIVAFLKLKKKG